MRDLSPTEPDPRKVIEAIKQLIQGRNNANGQLVFAPNTSTTTLRRENINADGTVFLTPRDAGAAKAEWHVSSIVAGEITFEHDQAITERRFDFVISGG